jgi:hypothetical protein
MIQQNPYLGSLELYAKWTHPYRQWGRHDDTVVTSTLRDVAIKITAVSEPFLARAEMYRSGLAVPPKDRLCELVGA